MTNKCACCKKSMKSDFINVNGGALLQHPRNPHTSISSRKLVEFLSINLHDDTNQNYDSAVIAQGDFDSFGQFEWYFCSKKCVREFFNKWLDKIPDIGEKDAG